MRTFFENDTSKPMPNNAQMDFLSTMFGLDGDYASIILQDNEIFYAVKILLLETGVTEADEEKFKDFLMPFRDFKLSNDFLDAIQFINTMYFNRDIDYTYGEPFPTTVKKPILTHYFSGLGMVNIIEFQNAISKLIQNLIIKLDEPYSLKKTAYWKMKITKEFMIKNGYFNSIQSKYLGDAANEKMLSKFWKDTYNQLNKESFISAINMQVFKSELNQWFKDNFKPDFLLLSIKGIFVNGIETKAGCLTNFASFHNNQDLLNFFFKKLSSARFDIVRGVYTDILVDIGNSPLHQAVIFQRTNEVANLAHIKDVNQLSPSRTSPLFLACKYGYLDIVDILLSSGADVNQLNEMCSKTALEFAINSNNFKLAEVLVKQGAKIILDCGHSILLNICSNFKFPDRVLWLLDNTDAGKYCNNFNTKHNESSNPFHIACSYLPKKVVEQMINQGADIHLSNKHGESPLEIAIKHKKEDTIEYLSSLLRTRQGFNY